MISSPSKRAETELWLSVASEGKTSGLASVQTSAARFNIIVLPKFWRPRSKPGWHSVEWDGVADQTVLAYELDIVIVQGQRQALADLALGISDLDDEIETPLLKVRNRQDRLREQDYLSPTADPNPAFAAFLDLLRTSQRVKALPRPNFSSSDNPNSEHLVITADSFLTEAEKRLSSARPRYSTLSDRLTSLRGRVDDRDLAQAVAYGRPDVLCHFDELSTDTQLLQVIRAATVVAATLSVRPPLDQLPLSVNARGVRMSRQLASVRTIPPFEALRIARTLRLSRLELSWKSALDRAIDLLSAIAELPPLSTAVRSGFVLRVDTNKLWEDLVFHALRNVASDVRKNNDNSLAVGVEVSEPWTATGKDPGSRYPDYLARFASRPMVLDAKYKYPGRGPGSADADQLFSYSHLSSLLGDHVTHAALIYPACNPNPSPRFLQRAPLRDMSLAPIELQFPAAGAARSAQSWNSYVTTIGGQLREWLSELARQPEPPLLAVSITGAAPEVDPAGHAGRQ